MIKYFRVLILTSFLMIFLMSGNALAATDITGSNASGYKDINYDKTVTINIIDMGADNTGFSDSRRAIQDALYEAKFNATDSVQYKIVIPEGTYLITDSLFIYSNTYLCMDDKAVILKGYDGPNMLRGGNSSDDTPRYSGVHNVIIEGGEFNANIENYNKVSFSGVRFGHSSNLLLKDVRFIGNVGAHHLEVAGSKQVTISGCYFTGYVGAQMKEAIQLDVINCEENCPSYNPCDDTSCMDVVIEQCTIENVPRGIGSHGAALGSYFTNITIKNNKMKNLKEHGIIAFNYQNCTITDNTMESVGYGISMMYMTADPANNLFKPANGSNKFEFRHSANYIINNNIVKANEGGTSGISVWGYIYSGTYINSGNYYMSDIKIYNNTTKDFVIGIQLNDIYNSFVNSNYVENTYKNTSGISGILVNSCNNVSIRSNKLYNCNGNGICVGRDSKRINIKDETISGSKNNGISINNNSSVNISKCSISKSTYNGIAINSSTANIYDSLIKNNNNNGVSYYDKANGTIKNSTIIDNKAAGISIAKKSNGTISSCKIQNNQTNGIGINASKTTISASTTSGNGNNGISVSSSSSSSINSNTITSNKTHGIGVSSSSNASISSNTITSNKSHGISVYMASATISKNTIKSNSKHGICISQGSKCNITSNKSISSNGGCGIVVTEKSTKTINISSNSVTSNKSHGISVSSSSNASISSNTITSNKSHGISVYMASAAISKNTIKSNSNHGICISKSSKCSITSNKAISSNGGCGIVITDKSSKSISIISNTISSNKKHGIAVSNKSTVTIEKNTITSNKSNGISVSNYSNGQNIYSNTIKANTGYGIAVSGKSTGIKIKGNTLSNSGSKNISISSGCKANVTYLDKITITSIKSSSKIIIGKATPKKTVTAYVGNKKIGSVKVLSNGKYTIKIAKQKKGKTITIKQSDSSGNCVYQYIVVK